MEKKSEEAKQEIKPSAEKPETESDASSNRNEVKSGLIKTLKEQKKYAYNELRKIRIKMFKTKGEIEKELQDRDLDQKISFLKNYTETVKQFEGHILYEDVCYYLKMKLQELEGTRSIDTKQSAYISLKEIYIKPEFENRLLDIENKIQNKIANWKSGTNKIECSAFVELLYDKKYIQRGRYNRKSCVSFAQNRYGIDIIVQMQSDKDTPRNKHKQLLEKYFK